MSGSLKHLNEKGKYLPPTALSTLDGFQKLLKFMLGLKNVFIKNLPYQSLKMQLNVYGSLEGPAGSGDVATPARFLSNALFLCIYSEAKATR